LRRRTLLINLQKGIVDLPTTSNSGEAVLANGPALSGCEGTGDARQGRLLRGLRRRLEDADRSAAATADRRLSGRPDQLADGLAEPSDLRITKRQSGAFYGTELDLQLRRRGVV
jgi:hypothetical protein